MEVEDSGDEGEGTLRIPFLKCCTCCASSDSAGATQWDLTHGFVVVHSVNGELPELHAVDDGSSWRRCLRWRPPGEAGATLLGQEEAAAARRPPS